MCLAVPSRIVELRGDLAVVEIGGVRREANVSFIESPTVGDFVLLHAGFAIEKWSEEDVREYNEIIREALSLDESPSPDSPPVGEA
jgi:hydrogenase expression/formation protein HypC